jgi:3-methyladenine DNA glycosylase AlkD
MIGIRVPIMRDVAKKISKSNIEEFLEYAQNKYYEEVMIQGLIISHIKDEKYKEFHSSLVLNSKYEMIGIRVPIMRKIAKLLSLTAILSL